MNNFIIIFVLFFTEHLAYGMKLESAKEYEDIVYQQEQICLCWYGLDQCPLTLSKARLWCTQVSNNCLNITFIVNAAQRIVLMQKQEEACKKKCRELVRNLAIPENNPQWEKEKEALEQELFPL